MRMVVNSAGGAPGD